MRIVVMGTGPFAVPLFQALLASPHTISALVTRPSVLARGRKKPPPNPMRDVAEEGEIPILSPASINTPEAHTDLQALHADLFVVSDYGQILSKETLQLAPLGGINLHGSLLPKYRGAAPIQWALYHGEKETGVTVIHMTPGLDAGPMLVQRSIPIKPEENGAELEERLSQLGVQASLDAIALLSTWDGESKIGKEQDASESTRAPRIMKGEGLVDWARSAQQICDQVRAFQPWPGSYTFWDDASGKSHRLILDKVSVAHEAIEGTPLPGEVVAHPQSELLLGTGEGILAIEAVQPAGKRVMSAKEYLCGHPLLPGTLFGKG